MEFTEFLEHMDKVEQGKEMLVFITDQLRAFIPMLEPPPVVDPVLEQQRADDLLHDLADAGLLHRLPPGVILTRESRAVAPGAPQVIVFNDAGVQVPA